MRLLKRAFNVFRHQRKTTSTDTENHRQDISEGDLKILRMVEPFTMTSQERIIATIDSAHYVSQHNIPGAFVECGVWRGGSSMAAMLTFLQYSSEPDRDIYLYDTFEGMTPPGEFDKSFKGVTAASQLAETPRGTGIWCEAGLEDVKTNIRSVGFPGERTHFIRGKVEDTIPGTIPERIAILRLDTDWYESTRHELEHLYPRLVSGGILMIDDYGHWAGARKAADEYFAAMSTPIFLNRIDYTGRIAVKP
jgi:O-methyltransferase